MFCHYFIEGCWKMDLFNSTKSTSSCYLGGNGVFVDGSLTALGAAFFCGKDEH